MRKILKNQREKLFWDQSDAGGLVGGDQSPVGLQGYVGTGGYTHLQTKACWVEMEGAVEFLFLFCLIPSFTRAV